MKTKDIAWYEEKVQDIKRRKRKLKNIQDPEYVKKTKKDLKREQRGVKRSERSHNKIYINEEINIYYDRE